MVPPASAASTGPIPVIPAPVRPEPVPPGTVSAPAGYQAGPDFDDPTSSQHKVRSHRNAGKPTREHDEENPADAEELDRLLGFFDEIRRAKAWDEGPNWTGENAKQAGPPAAEPSKVPTPRFGGR
jgi:hypothetical protein